MAKQDKKEEDMQQETRDPSWFESEDFTSVYEDKDRLVVKNNC